MLTREHEAVAQARHRLDLQRTVVGEGHPDYATGLNQLALLLIMHGDAGEAEPLLRQALEIRRGALGEGHPDFATNLSSLAGLLWARGDLDNAEPLLRQALDIRWQVLGADHAKTVASLSSLDQLLQMKRDLAGHERGREERVSHPPAEAAAEAAGVVAEPAADPGPGDSAAANPPQDSSPNGPAPTVPPESLNLAGLRERLDVLAAGFTGLGERLARAAEAIQQRRMPALDSLADDLRAGHDGFIALREEMARAGEALDVPGARIRAIEDRDGLEALLAELLDVEQKVTGLAGIQGQALGVLDRVLALRHAVDAEFAPLRECQERARERRGAIAASRPIDLSADASELAEGTHPLAALVTLVADHDQLSDDRWTDLLDAVSAGLGKPLAVAVGRSRIVLSASHPDDGVIR